MTPDQLFIAVPVYPPAGLPLLFVLSLIKTLRQFPQIRYELGGTSLVTASRNYLVSEFLATPCQRLLFLDSDTLFEPLHVEMILEHDEAIVGGLVPLKSPGRLRFSCGDKQPPPDHRGLLEVDWIGGAFLSIARSVFEKMMQEQPSKWYDKPSYSENRTDFDFFQVGSLNGFYLPEDTFFCLLARQLGFKVYADTRIQLRHLGLIAYPAAETPLPTDPPRYSSGSMHKRIT